jgi:hypothetical protein
MYNIIQRPDEKQESSAKARSPFSKFSQGIDVDSHIKSQNDQ